MYTLHYKQLIITYTNRSPTALGSGTMGIKKALIYVRVSIENLHIRQALSIEQELSSALKGGVGPRASTPALLEKPTPVQSL